MLKPQWLCEFQNQHPTLHLSNIDVLSDPRNGASLLIQLLLLQYLFTEYPQAPSPEGWNALSKTLRRHTMSNYVGTDAPTPTEFIDAFARPLLATTLAVGIMY